MATESRSFVQLGRTFHELAKHASESGVFDLDQAFFTGSRLYWDDLLKGYRTVILSEAGSGKTEEVRQTANRLRTEGKAAFFLRLEHIPGDFEEAFEVGTFDEFREWLVSTDEGWLLLDSVDEARLRNPGDFERAVRKLGRRIQAASMRTHIVLTGRINAWRVRTDLELCEHHLPITPETEKVALADPAAEGLCVDLPDFDSLDTEDSQESEAPSGFRIVTFDDLSTSQIETFARARGVRDTQVFLEEIERTDAETFTTRPQDLEELVEFWNKEQRIGTRRELMLHSVHRRLEERDQNHREVRPLAATRTREGARLLAAASTLGKEPTIQVPDGSHNNKGIAVQLVLPDWDDRDQQALLSRPIFDEAIYGTVRFHHRSVREFLTAEWLAHLLEQSASLREVEALLFREQYGLEVVVPTMRPVLSWLAILDERICERVLRIAPEALLEGGDPSALPLNTRRAILAHVCKELDSGESHRSALDYAAVQRFASSELVEDIRIHLKTYAENTEIVSFLIRMIWLGQLDELKDEAKSLAMSPSTPQYTRIAAIRAMRAFATVQDLDDLRASFLNEAPVLNRDWLSEIVTASKPALTTAEWLLNAIGKAAEKQRYSVDSLTDAVARFVEASPVELLPKLAEGLNHLLEVIPVIERSFCNVSQKNAWLIEAASVAAERLVRGKRAEALEEPTLGILHKFRAIKDWDGNIRDVKAEFGKLVPAWPDLNSAAFWYDVRTLRVRVHCTNRECHITYFWQADALGALWEFGVDQFDYAAGAIRAEADQDDKLVALTLAFDIYVKGNRPPAWLDQLHGLVRGNAKLEERLNKLLNPPASGHGREEKKWQVRAAAREKKERDERRKSKEFILSHVDLVRTPQLSTPSDISSAQWYLHEFLRKKTDRDNRWTVGRWHELVPEFGEEVAQAYREGVTNYWRKYRPELRSEGAPTHSTPIFVIFGLSGLAIEAAETTGWPLNLSKDEVLTACRYAAHELNGFPPWFPKLFQAYPKIVGDFLLNEIRQEVMSEKLDEESNYLLSDVRWSGKWVWEHLAPAILEVLCANEVRNIFNLGKLLAIVQGSTSVPDVDLVSLAQLKVSHANDTLIAATWFAVWVGVDPEHAIPAVTTHLTSITDTNVQTEFAMTFVTRIFGRSSSESIGIRQRYATANELKKLFLLMHLYIREDEDVDRAGGGVFSPGLRDDAQNARNALYSKLKQIPGKETYLALLEIATQHPSAKVRPWLASQALSKAEQEADLTPWSPVQVRDFYENLERTPTNHRELADLAFMRLLDLKDDLENGDDSVAIVLQRVEEETEMRNYLAHELRGKAGGRYTITQEEELADSKRPDLRFHGGGFDSPVPAELKLAERWSGPKLFERLENQLSGDYLRDNRSVRGFFVLVGSIKERKWQLQSGEKVDFDGLLEALREHWKSIANKHPHVEDITVIGIDLSKRFD